MKDLMKNFANLVKVKTIITIMVMVVFGVMALNGSIPSDAVVNVVLMVVAFYFGTQHEKKGGDTNGNYS